MRVALGVEQVLLPFLGRQDRAVEVAKPPRQQLQRRFPDALVTALSDPHFGWTYIHHL